MSLTIKSECGNAIYKVKKGMILERINPYSKQKYFKVVHNPRLKRGNSYYLSCVRSEYPDVFPEFCAASERNGDTGFNVKNMDEFKLISLGHDGYELANV
jgi:hypothetical protein